MSTLEGMVVALVDDEPLALDYLESLVSMAEGIDEILRFRNGRDVVRALQRRSVDVLFLDINMPGLDGFGVVRELQGDDMPVLIFATAHEDHALTAFEHNAVDYILKPFTEARVLDAVDRARAQVRARRISDMVEGAGGQSKGAALDALGGLSGQKAAQITSSTDLRRLPIKDGQQTRLVEFADIAWVEAAGDYMCVHVLGETFILRSTMKELEQKLPEDFVRIHRSTIVNLRAVQSVDSLPKGEALLNLGNGAALKVSRNYRGAIQHILS